jgi:hypothetical protein
VRAQVEETARKTRVRIEQMRLERETVGLSMEEIAAAVGDTNGSGEGSEPVAVGPGPDLATDAMGDDAPDGSVAQDVEARALQETGAPT